MVPVDHLHWDYEGLCGGWLSRNFFDTLSLVMHASSLSQKELRRWTNNPVGGVEESIM